MTHREWKTWTRIRWNDELFRHYFMSPAGGAQPVMRFSIGADDLALVVGDPSSPEAVQGAFENAMAAGCSRQQLERRLSVEAHDGWVRRGKTSIPPYVADLLFTCYAAALVNEEMLDVGDFRKRLKLLLKHDALLSDYPLSDLGRLWERFGEWLKTEHAKGAPLRPLALPDPRGETRIGYSKRLVFPLRRDRQVLVDVLARAGVDREPPVHDVLKLLTQNASRFTQPFQVVIARARAAFLDARREPDVEVLWSSVREAAMLAAVQRRPAKVQYKLFAFLDEDFRGELMLMSTGAPERIAAGLNVLPSDVHLGGCDHFISRTGGSPSGIQGAVHLLLGHALDNRLAGWEHSAPGPLTKEGVLLFTSTDSSVRQLVVNRPNDERVWALVANRWILQLLDLFPISDRPPARASRYVGWQEVGPFDGSHLAQIDRQPRSPLAQLRCLQPTRVGAQLHLCGGVRVDGGFLALRGVLPAIRVSASGQPVERVVAYAIQPNGENAVRSEPVATLSVAAQDATLFSFPGECGDGWEGRFNVVAYHGEHVVADRQITLHTRVTGLPFLTPTQPGRWWVESAAEDVVPADDPAAERPYSAESGSRRDIPRANGRPFRPNASGDNSDLPTLAMRHIEDDAGMDRFVEWAAGLASARRGLSELELLDMAESCFGDLEWNVRWDTLRSWAEIGAFDPLTDRTWRGRMWYARAPRLVIIRTAPEVVVGLVGLAGFSVRRRAARAVEAHGGCEIPGRTVFPTAFPVLRWVIPDVAAAIRAAEALDLGSIRWLDNPVTVSTAVKLVRQFTVGEQPTSGELLWSWDWQLGRFSTRPAASMLGIAVEQWRRRNGPDFFLVKAPKATWWTPSRNWALLVAHTAAGLCPYAQVGDTWLLRGVRGGLHLPLPVARAVSLQSGVSPGPWKRQDGSYGYGYKTADIRTRDSIASAIWGMTRSEAETTGVSIQLRHLLHAIASAAQGDDLGSPPGLVPIPGSVRRELMKIDGVDGLDILAGRRVPIHLIPHIRRLIARANS